MGEGGVSDRCTSCACLVCVRRSHVQLPHLVLDVALGEVLHVGELQVHLGEPDQDPLAGSLKVLSLRRKVLPEQISTPSTFHPFIPIFYVQQTIGPCDVVLQPRRKFLAVNIAHLESAENSGHSLLQAVPALVPLLHHDLELARCVGPVLTGEAAVLLVDQLQLREPLVDLPLERLR